MIDEGRWRLERRGAFERVAREEGGPITDDKAIEIKISPALLESLIIRRMAVVCGEDVDIAPARELAAELRKIVNGYRTLHSASPPYSHDPRKFADVEAIEENDVSFAIVTTALGLWPEGAEAEQSCWSMEQFDRVDRADTLHERYLRLCDRINGSNFAPLSEGP
jgi:hypothetical protein